MAKQAGVEGSWRPRGSGRGPRGPGTAEGAKREAEEGEREGTPEARRGASRAGQAGRATGRAGTPDSSSHALHERGGMSYSCNRVAVSAPS